MLHGLISDYIRQKLTGIDELEILEAGYGRCWAFDIQDIQYRLTGIDVDKGTLNACQHIEKDMHKAIIGDLRNANLPEEVYNSIYSSYALEHVEGAETVLNNFVKWIKCISSDQI